MTADPAEVWFAELLARIGAYERDRVRDRIKAGKVRAERAAERARLRAVADSPQRGA